MNARAMEGRVVKIFAVWTQVFKLLKRACPRLSIAVAILTALEAILGLGTLYLLKLLVDRLSQILTSSEGAIDHVLPILTLTGAVLVFTVIVQNLGGALRMRQGMLVREYVDQQMHDRAVAVDLSFYESPAYYDTMERARQGGSERPSQIVANVIIALRAALVLVIILALVANIHPLLLVLLLIPVAIALFVRLHFTRRLFDWRMQRVQMERRSSYLDWMLTSAEHARELRLNRTGSFFREQYQALRAQLNKGHMNLEQARLWSEVPIAILGAIVFVLASAWLLQEALTQTRPIGDVVLFVLLLRRAQMSGGELVGNVSKVVDDHFYLQRLFAFLSLAPRIKAPATPAPLPKRLSAGVALSKVSFRYPEAQQNALHDITLALRPGEIVALVGENGSGKTTLVKLLTRLYDPSSGSVTLEGRDIRDFDPEIYRGLFSVILQDYATYAETIGDNIRLGDVHRCGAQAAIEAAARRAGASSFIERLPRSYATPLTKLFDDGYDLSMGQWQRVALARAFYPNSQFVVLDEPTSAVDPKAEFELFENFREKLEGRGALIISHRLSTVRMADYAYVLEEGRIVEHGAHTDLMLQNGRYAHLFERQARGYRP